MLQSFSLVHVRAVLHNSEAVNVIAEDLMDHRCMVVLVLPTTSRPCFAFAKTQDCCTPIFFSHLFRPFIIFYYFGSIPLFGPFASIWGTPRRCTKYLYNIRSTCIIRTRSDFLNPKNMWWFLLCHCCLPFVTQQLSHLLCTL